MTTSATSPTPANTLPLNPAGTGASASASGDPLVKPATAPAAIPPAPPPIKAREVAERVLAWADEHHLLDQMTIGAQNATAQALGDDDLFPHTNQAVSTLRAKLVAGVLYNEKERMVYVLTRRKLADWQHKSLPQRQAGVGVKYLHYGQAQTGTLAMSPNTAAYREVDGRYSCGSSIHPARYPGAGTLGCLLRDASGTLYGLSANHVSGLANYAETGEKILAPGHSDITPTGRDPFTIGVHLRALPMTQGAPANVAITGNTDAAVFEIRDANAVSSSQGGYFDTPATACDPEGGMLVEKVGRTTGHTTGRIIGMSPTPQAVGYQIVAVGGNATVYFNNLMMVFGENGAPFSTAGDSGSLVVGQTENGYRAVGIVIAGTSTGYSLILPIQPILNALGMTLVTNHHA